MKTPHPDRVTYLWTGSRDLSIFLDGAEVAQGRTTYSGRGKRYVVSSALFRCIHSIEFVTIENMRDFVTTRLWDQEVPA